MVFGDRRRRTLSIHWPSRSASTDRFSGRLSHFVSKRPIWLAEAADPLIARSPTTQRIAGSRHSLSASFTSSYPASRPNTDWRRLVAWIGGAGALSSAVFRVMRYGHTPGVRGPAYGSARRRRWPPRSPDARLSGSVARHR